MDRTLLEKFLSGNATPAERQQVETLLNQSGTVIDECLIPGSSDSLIAAIRQAAAHAETAEPAEREQRTAALIEHIQSLISRQAIGKDDLEKLLDPAERDDELGRILRYRVLEFIACGGMGLVFKANDPQINRDVCIKIMNPALAAHPDAKMRFEREARAAACLHSERIVTVLEVGQHRQLPFLVMPLLAGESLRKRLQRDRRLEPRLACRIALQVAQGLRAAHAHGYLHRDIKPDNIWLSPDENVILLDLGLVQAKHESIDLTHSGTILGTPCYMSPEQVQGKPLQESSDLFSLGVVLFEMLTGVSPFDRDNVFSTMMSVANDTLPIPRDAADNAIPSALVPIVRKLLAKDPAARLQTADEVIQLLEPIASGRASTETRARDRSGWNRLGYLLAGAAAAALIGWASWLIYVKTDKGTLVVKADPSVELQIADQSLKVRDPQTGQEYQVRVGEQPLPSGVYLLELDDSAQGLTFSSSVITIRRAQTVLVSVELRGDAAVSAAAQATPSDSGPAVSPKSPIANAAASTFRLSDLPALDAAATQRAIGWEPGKRISPLALVQSPQQLNGVDAWSVQPTRPFRVDGFVNLSLSPDGKRVASARDQGCLQQSAKSTVYIWDDSFQLTHLLPLTGTFGSTHWSPDPNVLAVLCRGDRLETMVWRLCDDHAELLQVIPVAAQGMAWSPRGDQIAFQTDQGIQYYRLADQHTYSLSDGRIHGYLRWSPDGRLSVTSEKDAVHVWSLETGQLVHAFPKTSSARWLQPDGDLLIQQGADTQRWCEVWNVDTLVRKDFFAWSVDWVQFVTDDQFRRFAAITKDHQLVTGLIRGQKQTLKLDAPPAPRRLPDREWRSQTEDLSQRSVPALQLSRTGDTILLTRALDAAIIRVDSQGVPSLVTQWTSLAQPRAPSFVREAYRSSQVLLDRTSYSMQTGVSLSAQPFDLHTLQPIGPNVSESWSPRDNQIGGVRPSPRGTYLALAKGSFTVRDNGGEGDAKAVYDASSTIRIITAATGETYHEMTTDAFVQHLEWSDDERYLVLTCCNGADEREAWTGRLQILDLHSKELRTLPVDPDWSVYPWIELSDRSEERLARAEITPKPTYPVSAVVDDRLLVLNPEWLLVARGTEPVPLAEARSFFSRLYRHDGIDKCSIDVYDLSTSALAGSIPAGYFHSMSRPLQVGPGWMVLYAARFPSASCERILAGEQTQERRTADDWRREGSREKELHVVRFDPAGPSVVDPPDCQLDARKLGFDRLSLASVSPGGDWLCCFGPTTSSTQCRLLVLPTDKIEKVKAREDAAFSSGSTCSDPDAWDTPLSPMWHHTQPVLAWYVRERYEKKSATPTGQPVEHLTVRSVHWYDASSGTECEFKDLEGDVQSIRSMEFGWLVQDGCSILAFDYVGHYLGCWVDGSPPAPVSDTSQLNCWIDASGAVKSANSPAGFAAVLLRGNQFTVIPLESFQQQFADQLPVAKDPFDRLKP